MEPPKENYLGIISGKYIENFDIGKEKKVGEGGYSQIYTYENKVVKIDKNLEFGLDRSLITEAAYISKLQHPNVINLIDAFFTKNDFCILLPKANMDLKKYVELNKLTEVEIVSISYQLIRGVAYLHSQDILHGDLKPQNILIFDNTEECATTSPKSDYLKVRVVIADFGISRDNTCRKLVEKREVFTLWYRPPEILLGGDYTAAGDIWALGCIIYEITAGRPLFIGYTESEMIWNIFRHFGTPTEKTWPGVSLLPGYIQGFPFFKELPLRVSEPIRQLLEKMLVLNPNGRENTLSLLSNPIFREIKEEIDNCLKAPNISSINCSVSIINNAIDINDFKTNFYAIHLIARSYVLNGLYYLQGENKWDDNLINFTILLFDMLGKEIKDGMFIYSCLYVASLILDIDIYNEIVRIIKRKRDFIRLNREIIIKSKLNLHISTPLNILEVYGTNEIRDAAVTCLNLLNYTSISQRYPSEGIILLVIKIASGYLNKPFKYDNKLEDSIREEVYEILYSDFKEIKSFINFSVLNRGLIKSEDLLNYIIK